MQFVRNFALGLAAFLAMGGTALAATGHMAVMLADGCGCCHAWARHLEENGYTVETTSVPSADLARHKMEVGLTPELTSCHTGAIEGYVIEGHVPAREIERLLEERPDALGLAVPDMPVGSPGMGQPGPGADPYDVLLVKRDGSTEVYASYR